MAEPWHRWPNYVLVNLGASDRLADLEAVDLPDFVVHAALLGEYGPLGPFNIPRPTLSGLSPAERVGKTIDHLREHAPNG